MHVAQLRKELDDPLFARTGAGLAFTPGGLRLASRAVEILGLQQQTAIEVTEAAHGRRLLRIAASSAFAEHAAPGLIELFSSRANDLSVELSVHPTSRFRELITSRAVDIALGPAGGRVVGQLDRRAAVPEVSGPRRRGSRQSARLTSADTVAAARAAMDARPLGRQRRRRNRCDTPESGHPGIRSNESFRAMPRHSKRFSASAGVTLAIGFSVGKDLADGTAGPRQGTRSAGARRMVRHDADAGCAPARCVGACPLHHHAAVHPGDAARRRRRCNPIPAQDSRHAVELGRTASSARIRLAESHGPLCRLPLTKNVGVELRSISSASCASSCTRCSTFDGCDAHVVVEPFDVAARSRPRSGRCPTTPDRPGARTARSPSRSTCPAAQPPRRPAPRRTRAGAPAPAVDGATRSAVRRRSARRTSSIDPVARLQNGHS